MEAMLKRKPLDMYRNLFNSCSTHEETMEMIVPDAFPDIQRVVDTDGVVILRSKEAEPGKALVGGVINATVLYVPEGENEVMRLELKMPFTSTFESGAIDAGTRLTACVSLCSIDCRVMNPRKILVRADVLTRISGYGPDRIELFGAENDEQSIEMLRQTDTVKVISDVREKTFVITDEFALPASRPMAREILKTNCKVSADDMKTVGSKLIIKGTAYVSAVYSSKSDGELTAVDFSTVYSQIIEIDPAESPEFAVSIMTTGAFFDLADGPNGTTLINMELHAVAQVVVMENKSIEYITDAYSILYELTQKEENHSIDTVANTLLRETVRTTAETPVPARSIVWAGAWVGKTSKSSDENGCRFETPVTISVIFKSDDGRLLSAVSRANAVSPWEDSCENVAYITSASCCDVTASPSPGGIDLKVNLDLMITATKPQHIKTITGISYDETKLRDVSAFPSLTVKRVDAEETLWALAKRYNSTQSLIMDANALEGEPEAGRLVLIPKRR